MAGLGIGSAKVDLILPKETFRSGEGFTGKLIIASGDLEQEIDHIYLNLIIEYQVEVKDQKQYQSKVLDTKAITGKLVLTPESANHELTFSYQIPSGIPMSTNKCKYRFQLGLDIKNAIDPKDIEHIRILPSVEMEAVLGAIDSLGFKNQYDSGQIVHGGLQKFEFVPTNFMRGKLDELEITFKFDSQGVTLYMEIDKKATSLLGVLSESLDLDERRVALNLSNSQLVINGQPNIQQVAQLLSDFIQREYQKI